MNDIDKIKHDGAVRALKSNIDTLRYKLTESNWSGIKEGHLFTRLGSAINDARSILCDMDEMLDALREMEPENK